jgi:uncharacterized protein YxeA
MGMTVDIDIGGSGLDEYDDEEVAPDEDFEEVEAVEVMEEEEPLPPQRMPPSEVKKPSVWVKRILIGVVVIVLIIVALFGFIYFRTSVSDINVSLVKSDPNDLEVTVLVGTTGSASIAGDADLDVIYNDNEVHSSKVSISDGGTGYASIPYDSFVEGNGNYYVQVKYQGVKSPPAEYEVRYIVETLIIEAELGTVDSSGQLNLTVFALDKDEVIMDDDPRGAEIIIDEIKNLDDNNYDISGGEQPEDITDSFYEAFFPFSRSGNYSITVTLENTRAKPDSDYRTITETWTGRLNIIPIAKTTATDAGEDPLTYDVDFDASDSWNDGDILLYIWDFDGDGSIDNETTSPLISHTYSKFSSTIGEAQGTYITTLNVRGDVVDTITQEAEVGSLTIKIQPPA